MSIVYDILGSILQIGLTWLSRRRLPPVDGTLTVPGLSAPVEVIRDRWGVPHIYAANVHDLIFAQGYVHAQDRLWQMEVNRRLATGRLSEMFGKIALETDRAVRTFGFHRLAQADWEAADDEVRAVLTAYAAGVNAFLEGPSGEKNRPVEFSLLGHLPEPWRPEDSLAFARVMIWQLSHAWYGEIVRARLIEAVGPENAAELEIDPPKANPLTLPQGIEFNGLDPDGGLSAVRGPFLHRGLGSNAWTLAGSHTDTGKPILCNDMHLPLLQPGLWHQVHLVGGPFNVSGVSLPSVPLVQVGHNEHLAWGMTLAFTDCEDLFVERFDPDNPQRYQFRGAWHEAQVIRETIQVKGRAEPVVEEVIITRHGPVISDVVGFPQQRLAVQSMALRPCPVLKGWFLLDQAHDWDEFVDAMRYIEAPQLNVAYADVEGNIGYWVTGKVPVRAGTCAAAVGTSGPGMVPAPGWSGECEWLDEVPFEDMPHALNPARGYLVTCNQRIIDEDYPYFLGNAWMNGYRARRIVDVLEEKGRLSAADCLALQLDVTCLPGRELAQRLRNLAVDDPLQQAALDRLRAWDGQLRVDSVAGAIYEVLRYSLVRNLLLSGLDRDLATQVMGQGFDLILLPASEFHGHDTSVLLRLLDDPESWWLAQAGGREALIQQSLDEAVRWLRRKLGADMDGWQWGKIHHTYFPHALGAQKLLNRVFSRGPFSIGGDNDTPCATAIHPADPYDNKAWAPSFRQIVDLGDLSRSIAIAPPGQSGHLGSRHYDDLAIAWVRGKYQPMLWTREQVEAEAEGRLILSP
jgi:penicillin amidase